MARVLVIEDDELFRSMLTRVLELEGYEVLAAPEGSSGVAVYRDRGADVVVTDIIMPEKEGLETIRDLKKIDNEVKIIAISGGGRLGPDDYLDVARKAGARRSFEKPFVNEDFLQAVQELLAE